MVSVNVTSMKSTADATTLEPIAPLERQDDRVPSTGEAVASPIAKALVPRDAATLIVVDTKAAEPHVLMGRRRDDLIFLPGKYVFPGGRVDPVDGIGPIDRLEPTVAAALMVRMRGRPSLKRAHALGRAAIRETDEETGLKLGSSPDQALGALRFIARAVTPPGRVRRYDTRFFLANADLISGGALAGDGELSRLDWFSLDAIRQLELPGITRLVIEDLADIFRAGGTYVAGVGAAVPYYYHAAGRFQRDVLDLADQ